MEGWRMHAHVSYHFCVQYNNLPGDFSSLHCSASENFVLDHLGQE